MDVGTLQEHCLAKPGAWLDDPWGHLWPVVKVGEGERGRIFAFLGATSVGVKAARSREVADAWLARYPGAARVMAYIGRSGWNDLALDGIPDDDLLEAVDTSYDLVVVGLPLRHRPPGWDDGR
ncbi:MmcQ/YjbR family DNA-binding protein [Nocardioides litoris]|uniref:MmcQ/YjbR family DNA-binding protein n=1 Tax=Nocardioides litoris TaxID=1926648 RepID=UPI00111D2E2E|nr:MmcQ/YjbR family DNA-binding protein [Nocardioides litoris]